MAGCAGNGVVGLQSLIKEQPSTETNGLRGRRIFDISQLAGKFFIARDSEWWVGDWLNRIGGFPSWGVGGRRGRRVAAGQTDYDRGNRESVARFHEGGLRGGN